MSAHLTVTPAQLDAIERAKHRFADAIADLEAAGSVVAPALVPTIAIFQGLARLYDRAEVQGRITGTKGRAA